MLNAIAAGILPILLPLLVAGAIGLLIGTERGWRARDAGDGQRVAGIRTFMLYGLAGGLAGLLSSPSHDLVLAAALLAFVGAVGPFEYALVRDTGRYSATGMAAGLVTFLVGALAARGHLAEAAAIGVMVTAILAGRRLLHNFVARLSWPELRSTFVLLAMTFVLLPALPDRALDPIGAFNPHEIWAMTILIAAVNFAGYVGVRLVGERAGLLLAGTIGGLVSSTTVTWTFARLVKDKPQVLWCVVAAILSAWVVSLLRMTAIAAAIAPGLLPGLLPAMGGAALMLAAIAVAGICFSEARPHADMSFKNPFDFLEVVKFGAMIGVIMVLSRMATHEFGEAGLSVVAALSGFFDVDPITLSVANMVRGGTAVATGVFVILIAALCNGIAKVGLGAVFGGTRVGLVLGAAWAAAGSVGLAALGLMSEPA